MLSRMARASADRVFDPDSTVGSSFAIVASVRAWLGAPLEPGRGDHGFARSFCQIVIFVNVNFPPVFLSTLVLDLAGRDPADVCRGLCAFSGGRNARCGATGVGGGCLGQR